jgi:hypothetical protein
VAAWRRGSGLAARVAPVWLRHGGGGRVGGGEVGGAPPGGVGTDLGFGEFAVYIPGLFPGLRVEMHKVEGLFCKIVTHESPTGVGR